MEIQRRLTRVKNDNVAHLAQNSVSASGLSIAGLEIYDLLNEAGLDAGKE